MPTAPKEGPRVTPLHPLPDLSDQVPLNQWKALTRFLGDGRVCLSNNAAERALRGVAVGRRNWTFAGSDRGGERAATTCLQRITPTASEEAPASLRSTPARPF